MIITGIVWGWKRGLLESIVRIVSGILGIIVLVVIAKGVGNFIQGSYANVIMAITLLVIIRIIHKSITFLVSTFKLVRAIPIGKLADQLAGAALGAVEAVFVVWFIFLMIGSFDRMELNSWIIEQVSKSSFLTTLYYSNYLVELLAKIV